MALNEIPNSNLRKFVDDFEKEFKDLLKPRRIANNVICTNFFKIKNDRPKQKYSDWDLDCRIKSTKISAKSIQAINNFIISYSGFSDTGVFLAFNDDYLHIYQHATHAKWLQYMAIMNNVPYAPFIDLWVVGDISPKILTDMFEPTIENNLLEWATITAWRKLKNKNTDGARQIFQIYLAPRFPNDEEVFVNSPRDFFRDKVSSSGYYNAVNFLED